MKLDEKVEYYHMVIMSDNDQDDQVLDAIEQISHGTDKKNKKDKLNPKLEKHALKTIE